MKEWERRQTPRRNTLNFIDYVIPGENGGRGLGRTLNASETGLLLETHQPLRTGEVVQLILGLGEDLLPANARIMHVRKAENGLYHSGLEFLDLKASTRDRLRRHLAAFRLSDASD